MNVTEYTVIPPWAFLCYETYSDHRDYMNLREGDDYHYRDSRSYREFRQFFDYRPNTRVYIIEKPDSYDKASYRLLWAQEGARSAIIALGEEIGFRVIDSDSDEAQQFYRTRVEMQAQEFGKAINPFIPVFAQIGL